MTCRALADLVKGTCLTMPIGVAVDSCLRKMAGRHSNLKVSNQCLCFMQSEVEKSDLLECGLACLTHFGSCLASLSERYKPSLMVCTISI
jgi:hypothetical protein